MEIRQTIKLPKLPVLIQLEEGGSIPISRLSDAQLKDLGIAWTQALLKLAIQKREEAQKVVDGEGK